MTDKINLTQLREQADIRIAIGNRTPLNISPDTLLALIDIAETANRYVDLLGANDDDEMDAFNAMVDALARFDFGDTP